MAEIKITDETASWIEAVAENGAYSWASPGLVVSADVRVCLELMHEILATGTISVSRQAGRLDTITVTNSGSTQTFNDLEGSLDDAIASFDTIGEQDGYCP